MSEEILDGGYQQRKPVSAIKIGILSGLTGFIAFAILRLSNYLASSGVIESKNNSYLIQMIFVSIAFFGPSLASMLLTAIKGDMKRLYWRILLAGQLAFFISTLLITILSYIVHLCTEPEKEYMHMYVILAFLLISVLIFPASFIFWLIPGKLPYFRKQMEP